MQPLLSICIPTYNRCRNLERTLESIVTADGFSEEVEVVISDNASTDDTPQVGQRYASKYPNVKYYRNEENIRDSNFTMALDRGSGEYLKLNNDNRPFFSQAISYMLNAIKENQSNKTPLFFTCGAYCNEKKGVDKIKCNCLDDFIIHVSYNCTAIWIFGAWKEDWSMVLDKMRYSSLQLSQQDWFYQIVKRRGECLLMTEIISQVESIGVRSGYNWYQVHVDNYYTIMQPYYISGDISKKAYVEDHRLQLKRVMKKRLMQCYGKIRPYNQKFDTSGMSKIIWKHFKRYPFFYFYILFSPLWVIALGLKHGLKTVFSGLLGRN